MSPYRIYIKLYCLSNSCAIESSETVCTEIKLILEWGQSKDGPILVHVFAFILVLRPLAGYGPPSRGGDFVDHIFLEAQCLARILQHASPMTMAALSCNSLIHTLPYKIFDN